MKTYIVSGYSMFPPAPIVWIKIIAKNEQQACKHPDLKHVAILKIKEV
jgi:hypothetical protein